MITLPEGIHQISLPTPLPVGRVNAYLLKGAVPTLVDPGPATPDALAALREALDRLGMRLQDIWQVVITHPHVDHFGLAGAVAAEGGARILAHRRATTALADPIGTVKETVHFLRTWGEKQGIPPQVLSQMAWGHMGWATGLGQKVEVHEVLSDGDSVMAGNDFWRILHTPGHSSSHICLFRESDGTLVSGDHLLPGVVSSPLIEPTDDPVRPWVRAGTEYMASLSRLAFMDIRLVLPGHGVCFSGVNTAFLLQRIEAFRAQAGLVYSYLMERPRNAWELCTLLYPRLYPEKLFFGLSNIVGYLDLLTVQGRICCVPGKGGTQRFVALEAEGLAGD